ncbi:YifB family Mg chelatase-like AAA ATPase [Oleidesulfovibrio sp.]|uniref:YifB family Mg chelatase-like AAA ATPase n=1 Tax=Oleidesulfovibrio sp. TaxID=2909707 RepID=UPI003A860CE6
MLAGVACGALQGVDACRVDLEIDLARQGMPSFSIVGLAEGAVREAKERVFAALRNTGHKLPPSRITVNLAPASLRKGGSGYDLPLALGLLVAAGVIPQQRLNGLFVAGELSLTGEIKPVPGVLPLALLAKASGAHGVLVPKGNAAEAAVVAGLDVWGMASLGEAVAFVAGKSDPCPHPCTAHDLWTQADHWHIDFAEVKGQEHAKRAIEIAAAGAHNMLMIGPPGSGKTMLAQRISTVLPPLSFDEALEVTKVYSVTGQLGEDNSLVTQRPFRTPHHTISDPGLVGGGAHPRPGEVSLAHRGVLFLDELPEFKKSVLEVMRQPLEDGNVTISRAAMSLSYPADFMLVAAMNPCPCGYLSDERHVCHCTAAQIQRYRSRLSGPLLDRIDLHVEVAAVAYDDLRAAGKGENSAAMRERILRAREVQAGRYAGSLCLTNADLSGKWLEEYCRLGAAEHAFLEKAVTTLALSARAYTRILRIARTIADLSGQKDISCANLAEAVNCRTLDRQTL